MKSIRNIVAAHRPMDAVEAVCGDDNFADCAFAMLALAIGRLPPERREAMLQAIEVGGALSQARLAISSAIPAQATAP